MSLHKRLLHDLAELQKHPYINVALVPVEKNVQKACLILGPGDRDPLHLTVDFSRGQYPLDAPHISIDTPVRHPNIFSDYICASILNTEEGWTPAYTMKGIAIQLLSFFSSENLQQDYGGIRNLDNYRSPNKCWLARGAEFECKECGYDRPSSRLQDLQPDQWKTRAQNERRKFGFPPLPDDYSDTPVNSALPLSTFLVSPRRSPRHRTPPHQRQVSLEEGEIEERTSTDEHPVNEQSMDLDEPEIEPGPIENMPPEVLANICEFLDDEALLTFAQAWGRIGSQSGIVVQHSLLRKRELKCFVFKESFETAKLGVGVRIDFRGRQGTLSSEFDLLSQLAFDGECCAVHGVRKSVMGIQFQEYLPLAISRKHYRSVQAEIIPALRQIATAARLANTSPADVVIAFMNDVVVKLCDQTKSINSASALSRASERAIESYYHLFHLLLCIVTEPTDTTTIPSINRKVRNALEKQTEKSLIPNLGHFLISILLSDTPTDETILKNIIQEAITRNTVWTLDQAKGKGMIELAYLEANTVSEYRIQRTFDASRTSYTLLMFQNLFRQTINRGSGATRKTLVQMRDQLFDSHGAPPKGLAARLSRRIGELQAVNDFPEFIGIMGVQQPSMAFLTAMLRGCVYNSVRRGYSVWGISQEAALAVRRQMDPSVEVRKEWPASVGGVPPGGPNVARSFFPNEGRNGRGGRGGNRGGRGRGGRGRRGGY